MIEAVVARCIRHPWLVIAVSAVLTALAVWWTVAHFAINTDTARLISPDVPYRKNEIAFAKAFPQTEGLIVAVIDARSPEGADRAAEALASGLRSRPETFRNVRRPDATPFLQRNGLLLLPTAEVARTSETLQRQAPLLVGLVRDPTLRGLSNLILQTLQSSADDPAAAASAAAQFAALTSALQSGLQGYVDPLSWRELLATGGPPADSGGHRAIVLMNPVLDFNSLEPGKKAIQLLHDVADAQGVTGTSGVTLRLTGPVPLSDQEFATVAENAGLNMSLTLVAVAAILFMALRSARLILSVLATLLAGLACTAGIGLALVGELNLISIAFAVLFIGLGVDFGIQVTVRYRAERFAAGDVGTALVRAARGVRMSLTLAALSLLAGFFSFIPTEFSGVSELGLIAGIGMIVAYLASLTLLPALIAVMGSRPERKPVETRGLAAVDHWIGRHRLLVIASTAILVVAGIPFLLGLPFDSNPMNLRSPKVESVSTFIDLSKDPRTAPNTLDVLVPDEAAIQPMTDRLNALPEVARTIDIDTFVPEDQEQKLALIAKAREAVAPVVAAFNSPVPGPADPETIEALRRTEAALKRAEGAIPDEAGKEPLHRLAKTFHDLAETSADLRQAAGSAAFGDLPQLVATLQATLSPERVTRASLPPDLVADWIAPDGRARIEVSPKGDSNSNAVIRRFADAVRTVAPDATGAPVGINEGGRTIVRAFAEAGLYALIAITVILWIALRRLKDVVLALGPLVLAGVLTLEAAALVGLPLNFANIIALPLMFGVGVAFHIYYLIAWRAGITDVLASSLTRAIFFSALTTGVAFGSLYASSHPGTSSMGELLAISLVFTLLAAFIVVPAFLGPPPPVDDSAAKKLAFEKVNP
ncbi:MMPL family transporter [Aureimonas leprariae]|uniref:MMPL family transporter n=1 Tax=Plantimonas leprariae TaxID=2615207 RepID=A0A7V7PQJ3_9HYPH|nr:MMPL family transporter [Aureimonas leprariae]KAB0680635.1 MMPL family transporter [Aureimonas leprariae]